MRKKQLIIFVLFMTLLPFRLMAQSHNYTGQHISIKLTTGDSIQADLIKLPHDNIRPVVKDGKIVWDFIYLGKDSISFTNH